MVDDLASGTPWAVRGVEIRGIAAALLDTEPPRPGMSRKVIRITPTWLGSWGVDQASPELSTRS